jgi:tetratricopeptide (TPR) repeat protein
MSRSSVFKQSILILAAVVALSVRAASFRAAQDVSSELSRAQGLYFGAQFEESVNLLKTLETRLANDAAHSKELLQVKLYLGLAHLGMNQTEEAKARFTEVFLLDSQFSLDPKEFSPKVIGLFNEAKADSASARCAQICTRIDTLISQGNPIGARDAMKSATDCSCAAGKLAPVVDSMFERGKVLYDKGQFVDAQKEFNSILQVDPKHELASEYSNLSQQRLQLALRQSFVEWRTNFDAREYAKAAAAYERIRAEVHPDAGQLKTQIESEYSQALSGLLTSWKAACASGDRGKLDPLRTEAMALAPGLAFSKSIVSQMEQCAARVCLQGDPALALARLKSRVNPQLDPTLRRYLTRRIVINIEIDERGDVTVKDVANANDRVAGVLRDAVQQWKFYPAIIDNQPRCVETQLPISFIQQEMEN